MSAGSSELEIFLAHSVELESEARDRYEELAQAMASHNNAPVAEFFQRMAQEASQHLAEVQELAAGRGLPSIDPWDFNWPAAEPPETASYEALHYRMGLREAMALALENEYAAERYYRLASTTSEDPETRRIAAVFADEESSHAKALEGMLQGQPAASEHRREEDDEPTMPE